MLRLMSLGLTLMALGTADRTWAAGKPPWYLLVWRVNDTPQQCEPAEPMNTPEAHIALSETMGYPYKMVDVEERGEVVQTTMIRFPNAFYPKEWETDLVSGAGPL